MIGLQFKITLLNITPPIWRRIVVPDNYSFYDLHIAIQDAFGWLDGHLHSFEIPGNREFQIGIPDPDGLDFMRTEAGWKIKIKKFAGKIDSKIKYSYDFGDGWVHTIEFEKINAHSTKKPVCLDGERACPPEDCGGVAAYEDFCAIMKSKKGREYKEMKQWYGKDYDPEEFDPKKVTFDDPKMRLKILLEMQ
jgi:hypothetical protein